jgi:uncharacterized protein (DUF111 family)
VVVSTEFGGIPVKVSRLEGKIVTYTPSIEDCARLARERGVPLKTVQNAAIRGFDAHDS